MNFLEGSRRRTGIIVSNIHCTSVFVCVQFIWVEEEGGKGGRDKEMNGGGSIRRLSFSILCICNFIWGFEIN